ncbi:hypothetical protein RIVM261_005690 [Rivularia sp. IAM M-261]|nr:hypothetical protein RIVM261_005690 [Rivularia sp. IAM M-261]
MHDDLIDGVNWLINEGIADKTKIAIMGTSYGGYADERWFDFYSRCICLRYRPCRAK